MHDSLTRLHGAVCAARGANPGQSKTARLLRDGAPKIAKKLVEEAAEVGIEAVMGSPDNVVLESADLLYHLAVLWAHAGVSPQSVFAELDRRERLFGVAEKLPKRMRKPQLLKQAHRERAQLSAVK
ncbi:MAG: phosphoribosyl-ATP pyrophosphatase [Hyphomicrobiales bacterium]|jgi:phosphoribosyl-ATP pyrophosphohydrolase|nr:phosphoribosyl-ATP pyrophosphatase [Hyphomicrobiales bacterium]